MRTLTYQKGCRLGKLQDELLAAIPALRAVRLHPADDAPTAVMTVSGDTQTLTLQVPDATDTAAVDAVVAAHDPATPGAWEQNQTAEATNDSTIRDRLTATLATLESAQTNWPTLTAAQKDAATRQSIRATAGLIRLLLRRLDAAG